MVTMTATKPTVAHWMQLKSRDHRFTAHLVRENDWYASCGAGGAFVLADPRAPRCKVCQREREKSP